MPIQSWKDIISTIENGEPVSATVANRAVQELAQRTEHLKARQDAQDFAQALFISDAPLANDVLIGHAVYFNAVSNKFEKAYADVEFKEGLLQATPSSNVVGILMTKDTTDSGVILVEGWVDPDNYDYLTIEANMLLDYAQGILYLASGLENAGRLSNKPGLISVPVCNLISNTAEKRLLVRPPVTTALNTQALKFKLVNEIAGYGLWLRKGSDSTAQPFSQNAAQVGERVQIYLKPNSGTPTLYLTATVSMYRAAVGQQQFIEVNFKDLEFSKDLIKALAANQGNYADILKSSNSSTLIMKDINSTHEEAISSNSFSSYIAPLTLNSTSGWIINGPYTNEIDPGWLPADHAVFENAIKPANAKYGYNIKADSVLNQLFPEDIVTAYVVTKDGVGLSNQVVEVNASGIWWKDSVLQLPWKVTGLNSLLPDVTLDLNNWTPAEKNEIIMPTELHLVYAKLATGGLKIVTSIEAAENTPIVISDPFGNPANTGPLKITAGMEIKEATTNESGSLVVKNFNGFNMHRGRVVERVVAGENIKVDSTFSNGQGELVISVDGLDGKLEGQPDILAVDDILVEKDSRYEIFYYAFPPGKASSMLGKIDVPSFLGANYSVQLNVVFVALHSTGSVVFPNFSLTALTLPSVNTKSNLSDIQYTPALNSATVFNPYSNNNNVAIAVNSRDCVRKSIQLTDKLNPGSCIFFKLNRNAVVGGGDNYSAKVGVISVSYKFVK